MQAKSTWSSGTFGSATPIVVNGKVRNAAEVTLHRGNARITFRADDPLRGDFDSHVDGVVHPRDRDGVSVSVLADDSVDVWMELAHEDLVRACRHRLIQILGEYCDRIKEEDPEEGSKLTTAKNKILKDRKKSYSKVLEELQSWSQFDSLIKPVCNVKVAKPWYDWAQLVSDPKEGNPFHCLLELVKPTRVETIDAMAQCQDGGWLPCPFMLRAAAKPSEELRTPEFNRKGATAITCAVWEALDFLLLEFRQGSDSVSEQDAYEICLYRHRIARDELLFRQQQYSGLECQARLAAFVELAQHMDYWIDHESTRLIVEHDMQLALRNDFSGARIVRSSFVAFFDSGVLAHSSHGKPNFHDLPKEGLAFLIRLLRTRDIGDVCTKLRGKIDGIIRQGEADIEWTSFELEGDEEHRTLTDATIVAGLLHDRIVVQPVVVDGSATFMAPLISLEVSQQLERSMKRSEDVQRAFAVVMEIHLLMSLGVPEDQMGRPRATHFITALEAAVDSPMHLHLRTRVPSAGDPVSVGVIRFSFALSKLQAREIGICMHNLLHTMNSAVWRISSRHRVWCTSQEHGFKMNQVMLRSRLNTDPNAKRLAEDWAEIVAKASRDKLTHINLVVDEDNAIRAKNPALESFIILVTWDDTLCRRALNVFENEGLKAFGQIRSDYRTQWRVDMRTGQLGS